MLSRPSFYLHDVGAGTTTTGTAESTTSALAAVPSGTADGARSSSAKHRLAQHQQLQDVERHLQAGSWPLRAHQTSRRS